MWVRARLSTSTPIARHAEPDTLIGDQVVQVREPRQKRLLIAAWMVKCFHHEQLPVDPCSGLRARFAFFWASGAVYQA
jgi:hypothetical protein